MGNVYRSFLFVPADKPERASKAAQLSTDTVIIELEDGVSLENKSVARENAKQILAEIDFGQQTIALRPNRITTLSGISDILAMSTWPRKPDLLILPKVESAGEVMIYDALLTEMGADCKLMVLIESSRGLLKAASIVTASSRTTYLSFGLADLSAELGCKPTWEVLSSYRSSLVASCGIAGVIPIDTAFLDLNSPDGLALECQKVHDMGYAGKLCIHPSQLDIVNTAFTPTQEEINWAQKIVKGAETKGLGAIVVDGRMIDKPVIESARRIVAMATLCGL
jgi:(S)-citramalyl-CoA lyase